MPSQRWVRIGAELTTLGNKLNKRCLCEEAKWCFETVVTSFPDEFSTPVSDSEPTSALYGFAKSLIECKEYRRCYHLLTNAKAELDRPTLFLQWLSLYLAGEKQKFEKESELVAQPNMVPLEEATNDELGAVEQGLKACGVPNLDEFELYLMAKALDGQGKTDEAAAMYISAITKAPLLWHAWMGLVAVTAYTNVSKVLAALGLDDKPSLVTDHPLCSMFLVTAKARLGALLPVDGLDAHWENINEWLGEANTVLLLKAKELYLARQYGDPRGGGAGTVHGVFETLEERDPYLVDGQAIRSNMLHIQGNLPELTKLAHRLSVSSPMRVETACVVANYHSNAHRHGTAVRSLIRGLHLNRRDETAWTILGHELVSMKNVPLAIECYRRVLRRAPHDRVALKHIGQCYDLLQMNTHSTFFYDEALKIGPDNVGVLRTLADSHDRLGHVQVAARFRKMAEDLGG